MGRFNQADAEEIRAMIEDEASFFGLEHLLGLHGWSRGAAPRPTPRPRSAGGFEAAVIRHDWTRRTGERSLRPGSYVHPGDAARARAAGASWHRGAPVPVEARVAAWRERGFGGTGLSAARGLMYFPNGHPVPDGLRILARNEIALSNRLRDVSPAAAFQAYIERDGAPENDSAGRPISLGWIPTLSDADSDQLDRIAFWREAEKLERRGDARIQGRIIAELPYEPEVGPDGRRAIVEELGVLFDTLGLPWWGVVHKPEPGHDERNFHLHLLYSERPWAVEFDIDHGVTWSPAARKTEETRRGDWIDRIRETYVRAMNDAYARAGLPRRIAKDSYEKLGMDARPQRHLGNAAAALERRGIATGVGMANGGEQTRREVVAELTTHGARRLALYEQHTAPARATILAGYEQLKAGTDLGGFLILDQDAKGRPVTEPPRDTIRRAKRILGAADVTLSRVVRAELDVLADRAMRKRWPDRADAVTRSLKAARAAGIAPTGWPELDRRGTALLEALSERVSRRLRSAAEDPGRTDPARSAYTQTGHAVIQDALGVLANVAQRVEAALGIARLHASQRRQESAATRYREAWREWAGMAPGLARIYRISAAKAYHGALRELVTDGGLDPDARRELTSAAKRVAAVADRGRGSIAFLSDIALDHARRTRTRDASNPTHARRVQSWDVLERSAAAFQEAETRFASFVADLRRRLRAAGRAGVPQEVRSATLDSLWTRIDVIHAETALAQSIRAGLLKRDQSVTAGIKDRRTVPQHRQQD